MSYLKKGIQTLTTEEAAQNLSHLIALTHQEGQHFLIQSEEGKAVLLSEETYQNLVVTLELLSTPGLMNGIKVLDKTSAFIA